MKKCNRCNKEKSKKEFFVNSRRSDGLQTYCKPCHLEYGRERYANPEAFQRRKMNRELYKEKRKKSSRKWYLKSTYDITEEEYNKLFLKGNEKCWICKSITKDRLNVDHDHKTGKIRGLLCGKCNRALGLFQDDKNIIMLAAKYLKKFEGQNA